MTPAQDAHPDPITVDGAPATSGIWATGPDQETAGQTDDSEPPPDDAT